MDSDNKNYGLSLVVILKKKCDFCGKKERIKKNGLQSFQKKNKPCDEKVNKKKQN
jgi:hypothetical protein